jgi:hypothetical protein
VQLQQLLPVLQSTARQELLVAVEQMKAEVVVVVLLLQRHLGHAGGEGSSSSSSSSPEPPVQGQYWRALKPCLLLLRQRHLWPTLLTEPRS